jgi:hypothetical protein
MIGLAAERTRGGKSLQPLSTGSRPTLDVSRLIFHRTKKRRQTTAPYN